MIEYSNDEKTSTPRELFWLFLRLGATAFGGPLAHIALMQREFVDKRQWFSRDEFVDMIGATNLIPGPNSSEMAMHIGQRRGGWKGLVCAGIAFILPAALLMTLLAAFYVRFGSAPQLQAPLRGLSAVVVAVIAHALGKFGRTALKNALSMCVAFVALVAAFRGADELSILLGAALFGVGCGLWKKRAGKTRNADTTKVSQDESSTRSLVEKPEKTRLPIFFGLSGASVFSIGAIPTAANVFLIFLKIGAVLYGSGYVLLAFLQQDFVVRSGWMTNRQLLDAVAFGQFTPGPLFTTATFIGYLLGDKYGFAARGFGGVVGALAATIGIFLPSFVFVGLLSLFLKKWRNAPFLRPFLDVVNAVSWALMAVVTWQLGAAQIGSNTVHNAFVAALFGVALALLCCTRINSVWLLIGGAIAGFALHL